MSIVLTYAEKSGTKTIAHDLHFQAAKYEVTHVLVHCPPFVKSAVCTAITIFGCRNSQNHLKDFSKSSLNQARHQATLPPPLRPLPLLPKFLLRHPRRSLQTTARNENPRTQTTIVGRKRCQGARSGWVETLTWNVWLRPYTGWGKMIYCRL